MNRRLLFMKNYITIVYFMIFTTSVLLSTTYKVGPGQEYGSILEISTHNMIAGDSIIVYPKSTPYYEKFLLHGIGTSANPIIIKGIADSNGNKPIIDGNNALSNTNSSYYNEDRQVVLIGQAGSVESDYIVVDGFVIRGANNFNSFTDDADNTNISYQANACGIRVSWGRNITIRNCDITENGNGIQSGMEDNMNLLIEYCNVFDNGRCTWNNSYIHNFYLSSGLNSTVTLQYCHVGELLSNGQQVRSRAQTTVIRYNWIEGGRNSSLDLMQANYSETNVADAFVYGNVLIKPNNSVNSRIIHFGSDNTKYRLGTCYFYNNTVIIKDTRTWGSRRVFQLSSDSAYVIADNNIVYKPDALPYQLFNGVSTLSGDNNWVSNNITGMGSTLNNTLVGVHPNFIDEVSENYNLNCSSPCTNVVSNYYFPLNHDLSFHYVKHLHFEDRPINGDMDIGAYESPISQVEWVGSISSDWNDPLNWCNGIIPSVDSDVVVPDQVNYNPRVNVNAGIKSLTVLMNANLLIESGVTLDVKQE